MTWNINGWTENNCILRENIISHLKPHILCIIETHLDRDRTIQVNGYQFIKHNRTVKHRRAPKTHGGVGILVKDELYETYNIQVVDKSIDGILGVKFTNKVTEYDFIVFACYLAPDSSPYGRNQSEYFGHLITQLYLYSECDQIYICGDFNGRIGELDDSIQGLDNLPKRHCLDKTVQGHGEALIGFMNDVKLCTLNGRVNPENDNYTCISSKGLSVVDYIMTPHDVLDKCVYFKVYTVTELAEICNVSQLIGERCRLPDHSVLHVNFNPRAIDTTINNHISPDETSGREGGKHFIPYNKRTYRFDNVPDMFLASDSWRYSMTQLIDLFMICRKNKDDFDNIYDKFCKVLSDEMNKFLKYTDASKPIRKRFNNKKPYWNEELSRLWKEMSESEKVYTKYCGPKHIKESLKKTFVHKRNIFDKNLRKTERLYNRNVLTEIDDVCTSDPREFWNYISKLGPRKSNSVPMKVYDTDGQVITDTERVLNKWKEDFQALYECPQDVEENFDTDFYNGIITEKMRWEEQMESANYQCNQELNKQISFHEIELVVRNLKSKKSTGVDNIPNEVLKNHNVMLLLYYFYVKCFEFCMLPSVWLKAVIVPVPKSSTKDPFVPLNYRGISILSCVCKVFSGIINKRIVNYFELGNLFVEEQNGFRKKRACIDHIYSLTSMIRNRLADNKETFACYIDMQKAFDWVDREMLFYKLLAYNIDGNLYKCIKALYNHPLSCVRVNTHLTDWFCTENGVRQGDSLSPTLFAVFINDLVKEINDFNLGISVHERKVSILLFADDIVILGENAEELQVLLDYVEKWCKNWRMKINMDKTKIVHYRKKCVKKTQFPFSINNTQLEIVDTYKYLGIYLDEHLDYGKTGEVLAGAGGRALGSVISKFKSFRNVGFKTFEKLYMNGVIPIMDYCAGVWGYGKMDSCNKVQYRAIRYYLGVHQKTPLLALEGDVGWIDSQRRRHVEMSRLWNRLIVMDDSRLTKQIFQWDYDKCKGNWCQEMKEFFNSVDEDCYTHKTECNVNNISDKCYELWTASWKTGVSCKAKLRTYKLFKENPHTENYVKYCRSRPQRSLLAQLRCGILPLHIETGRYRNLKVEERICNLCKKDEIEDEIHFVCKCEELLNPRKDLYSKISDKFEMFAQYNDKEKFLYLMTHEWKLLSLYIQKAWNLRTSLMYL